MKRIVSVAIVMVFFLLSCCKSDEELRDLGKEAAIEFCDCYRYSSQNDCLEKLKSKYSSSDYMSSEFISAFNNQSTCGITLEKKYMSAAAAVPSYNVIVK